MFTAVTVAVTAPQSPRPSPGGRHVNQRFPPSPAGVRHLELARNRLTALPASLGQLYQLEVLDLRQNQLTALPEFTDCHALKELHVGFNQIKVRGEAGRYE